MQGRIDSWQRSQLNIVPKSYIGHPMFRNLFSLHNSMPLVQPTPFYCTFLGKRCYACHNFGPIQEISIERNLFYPVPLCSVLSSLLHKMFTITSCRQNKQKLYQLFFSTSASSPIASAKISGGSQLPNLIKTRWWISEMV